MRYINPRFTYLFSVDFPQTRMFERKYRRPYSDDWMFTICRNRYHGDSESEYRRPITERKGRKTRHSSLTSLHGI